MWEVALPGGHLCVEDEGIFKPMEDLETLRLEFEEFKAEAKDYESELEAELSQKERQLTELTRTLEMTQDQLSSLQSTYTHSEDTVSRLSRQLQDITDKEAAARAMVRRLELQVDALENTVRSLEHSKGDLEEQLYSAKEEEVIVKEMLAHTEELSKLNLRRLEQKNQELVDDLSSLGRGQSSPSQLFIEIGTYLEDSSPVRRTSQGAEVCMPFEQVFEGRTPDNVKFCPVREKLKAFKKGTSCCVLVVGTDKASLVSLMMVKKTLLDLKDSTPLSLRCEEVNSQRSKIIFQESHLDLSLATLAGRRSSRDSSLVWTFSSADAAFQIVELNPTLLESHKGALQLLFDSRAYSQISETVLGQALAVSMKSKGCSVMSYLTLSLPEGVLKQSSFKAGNVNLELTSKQLEQARSHKSYSVRCAKDLENELATYKASLKVKEARILALTSRLKRKEQRQQIEERPEVKVSEVALGVRPISRSISSQNGSRIPVFRNIEL
jgi:DNA repair exonuclease SbcCD ATPase subunit